MFTKLPATIISAIAFGLILPACGGGGGSSHKRSSNDDGLVSGLTQRPQNSACLAFSRGGAGSVDVAAAFGGLNFESAITGILQAPGDNSRWYVIGRNGLLAIVANDDNATAFTRVSGVPAVNSAGEGGLLGMAFHPQFASNRLVFLSYTATTSEHSMVSRIMRFTLTTDNQLTNATLFLELVQPAANHNGGNIAFGPDGYLYIGFGDGGGANDQFGNGQQPSVLLAKLLRVNVDQPDTVAGTPYSIPASNPFVGIAGYRPEIYAQGFRNPWRWSFDPVTDRLIMADVGQNQYEEIDIVERGKNYGWPITEGKHCFNATNCNTADLTAPIFEYNHDEGGCSITGGFVYRGSAIPQLYGKYIYSDYCASGIESLDLDTTTSRTISNAAINITTFGQSNDGEILAGADNGNVFRIIAGNDDGIATIPQTLSTHPCFSNAAAQQLSSGVIPYSVNSPLWSDGADKTRFVALPNDQTVSVGEDGDMTFPVGSVLIKQFSHAGKPLETRFLMHHDTGWAGYSYEWNDEGTDATLSTAAHTKTIDGGYTHIFPSSAQCFQCHTDATHIALGLETAQLNGNYSYASSGISANQLDTWQHIGLFDADLSAANRNRYIPAVGDTSVSIEQRARSYLHSNCSGCHRPGGFPDHFDLRYDTALADTGICNATPTAGDLGISGAKLLVPGNTAASLVYQRMNRRGEGQMPPLASDVVDAQAVAVIGEWIGGMTGCP